MELLAHRVLDKLESARQRWWLYSVLCWAAAVGALMTSGALAAIALDAWLRLPQFALAVLLGSWLLATAGLTALLLRRIAVGPHSLAATARRVESALPQADSHLINLVQFTQAESQHSSAFCRAAIRDAGERTKQVEPEVAAAAATRWQRFRSGVQTPRDLAEAVALLLLCGLLGAGAAHAIPNWSSSVSRFFAPWRFVPQTGAVEIVAVTPGDADVLVGAELQINVAVKSPADGQLAARLFIRRGDGPEAMQPLTPSAEAGTFQGLLASINEELTYRVEVGDSQSDVYEVRVHRPPSIAGFDIQYEYPEYLAWPPKSVSQLHGDLAAPQATLVRLRCTSERPLARAEIELSNRRLLCELSADGRELTAHWLLTESGEYRVQLTDALGLSEPYPRAHRIDVAPDAPPTVELIRPALETTLALGTELLLGVRSSDDHGLGALYVESQVVAATGTETATVEIVRWADAVGSTQATRQFAWTLATDQYSAGQTLRIRAVAADRRQFAGEGLQLTPQTVVSGWHVVHLVDLQEQLSAEVASLAGYQAALAAILEEQLRARCVAAQLAPPPPDAERPALCDELVARQVQVQQLAQSLIDSAANDSGEDVAWRAPLAELANNQMLSAVPVAEQVQREPADAAVPTLQTLTNLQDEIVAALQALLNGLRAESARSLAELDRRSTGDLPTDVQEKLQQIHDRLEDFLEQQRRAIEATADLAKKPVDDFTPEDEQQLAALAALEDDFSRFLEEAHSDLSRLPEQDFSNPSLLEEFVEVQTQIEMAEGALTQKAVELAVPLEQLGAEMAEEMTTNIEKWLPDTPDRERWSQEEPLAADMQSAPMAELPGELEDIVGDLMEEEEDLFDELEDITSSWADSIDKGAGWDALDGPISNMSARGVTGNRLPNNSEIAGRSGEGRQGRSSGEFVGNEAVGKGGRRTPNRLTPDPFVAGQVEDHSRDPVGGATGGGKESGAGGVGLEGPAPDRPQRDLGRLAGRQASLRNRAEGIDLQFEVLNFQHVDLSQLIERMRAIEADLQGGDYESALRQREALLEELGQLQTTLASEAELRRDETPNLPAPIQDEILAGSADPIPEGWEDLVRQYYERLAASGAAPEPAAVPPAPQPSVGAEPTVAE